MFIYSENIWHIESFHYRETLVDWNAKNTQFEKSKITYLKWVGIKLRGLYISSSSICDRNWKCCPLFGGVVQFISKLPSHPRENDCKWAQSSDSWTCITTLTCHFFYLTQQISNASHFLKTVSTPFTLLLCNATASPRLQKLMLLLLLQLQHQHLHPSIHLLYCDSVKEDCRRLSPLSCA